jgi:hypothetical protein
LPGGFWFVNQGSTAKGDADTRATAFGLPEAGPTFRIGRLIGASLAG